MSVNLSKSVFSGVFWKFSERILAQLISFVVSIVIARILTPEDYGLVAMGMIFINIANVFVSNGFSAALIQKKDSDDLDFSTLFYCSLAISIILYILIYLIAPLLAKFYENEFLIKLVRVFGFILPLSAYKSIQSAYVSKTLDFKKFFFSTLAGTIVSAFVGIFMALKGWGVWALVAQYFTNNIIDSLVLTFTIKWKPKLIFSLKKSFPLLSYGAKVLGADLIGTIYNQLNAFLIGKKYTASNLAYYTKGKQFPDLISNNICSSLSAVLFPAFSIKSDDKAEMKRICRKTISVASFILLPLYFGLIAVSTNLVKVLLTDKWISCVPFLIIMCINGIIGTLDIVDIQMLKALGRSDTVLKMEFVKKPLYIIITIIALRFNLIILAFTLPVSSVIAIVINSFYVNKYIGYSLWRKIKDSVKSFVAAFIMGILVYLMNYININQIFLLFLQIMTGVITFVLLSYILRNKNMNYCINLLRGNKIAVNN